MDAKKCGITRALLKVGRFGNKALDVGTVFALEVDVLGFAKANFGQKVAVGVGDLLEFPVLECEHLWCEMSLADERDDCPASPLESTC